MKLSNILNFLKNISFKRKFNKTKNLDKYNKLYKKDKIAASKYLMW